MIRSALVFGATGAIGGSVSTRFAADGFEVWGTGRSATGSKMISIDPANAASYDALGGLPTLDAVVWAQGVNQNDDIDDIDVVDLRAALEANTVMVVETLHRLRSAGRLVRGARLCVISSIWQQVTRQRKLSYTVSKAALDGVVRAVSIDLAADGIFFNAVLPGVLDTPMTRRNLNETQIGLVERSTGFGRLVQLDDVANTVMFLCSSENSGITGQSIAVDLGFGHGRTI